MKSLLSLRLKYKATSSPLDGGTKVELKFDAEFEDCAGELYLRVPKSVACEYEVGDIYSARFVKLP